METYTLIRDNRADLKFNGELIASSSGNTGTGTTLWLAIYKTKAGRFVCERVNMTQWIGHSDCHEVTVCDSEDQIINFFDFGRLAKDLYDEAGIEADEVID